MQSGKAQSVTRRPGPDSERAIAPGLSPFLTCPAAEAAGELRCVLATLRTNYVDVLTLYYVERRAEWDALAGPGGALEYCRAARRDGTVRRIGVTSHQRPLA